MAGLEIFSDVCSAGMETGMERVREISASFPTECILLGGLGYDRDRISVLNRRHEENIIYPINSANNFC